MRICHMCKKECKKTMYGTCVIICKSDTVLCIRCNSDRLKYEKLLYQNKLFNYIMKRQLGINTKV